MKKTIAVIFGGQSSEHDISCLSAQTIIRNIDTEKYDLLLIGITKDGRWLKTDSPDRINDGTWRQSQIQAIIVPDAGIHGALLIDETAQTIAQVRIDIVFPVLHGLYGEDGTIQGLLAMAQIPYVGCGVLASAVSMDKVYTKVIVNALGDISQARFVTVHAYETETDAGIKAAMDRVESAIPYPVFVKPSCAGSSCGVTQAHDRDELAKSLKIAAAEDSKILVEETITGRELECAVFKPAPETATDASGVGEILAADTFYTFDAKYNNSESRTVIDPPLPEGKREEIRAAAKRIFDAVGGLGLSRVDFFMENGTNRIIFNEINTLPGFTSISMYPQLWAAAGKPNKELVDALIDSALTRR